MCTKKLIKALGLIIVVALLAAALPTGQAQAASVVMTEAQLTAALADTSVTEIELGANIALTSTAYVTRDGVSIDGKNFTITGPSVYHGIDVSGDNVTIKNLTITAAAKSNLQFYRVTGGIVTDVVLSNAGNAGMIVNGSVVTISNVTTSGNAWGGINVDQGSGVTEVPLLTVTNVTHHTSPAGSLTPAIWVDTGNAAWVSAAGLYIVRPGTPLAFFDIAEFTEAFPVHNVTQDTYFSTIQAAIAAAVAGDTINVAPGEYVEVGQIVINKNLTIVGADKATTIIKPAQNTGSVADERAWFLVNSGVEFNLSNVTLDGAGYQIHQAIRTHGSGTIDNNIIKNMYYTKYIGFGIAVYDGTAVISNNTFTDIERVFVHVYGVNPTQTHVINNVFTGAGAGDKVQYAIEVGGGGNALIENNTISNFRAVAVSDGSGSAGILVTTYYATGTKATILDNTITNNLTGVYVGYDENDTSDVQIEGNTLTNNDGQVVSTARAVDASPNWWGSIAGPGASQIVGPVTFVPWCGDAACSFLVYPMVGTDLQASINATPVGGTLYVPAGTYSDGGVDGYTVGGKTIILGDGVVIQANSPCFTVTESYTTVTTESIGGAKCVLSDTYGIDVNAGLKNIIIEGIYFDTTQAVADVSGVINFKGAIEDVLVNDNYFDTAGYPFVYDGIIFTVQPTGYVEIKGNLFEMAGISGCAVNNFNGTSTIDARFNSFGSMAGHPASVPGVRVCEHVDYGDFTHADVYLESSATPWLNQEVVGQPFTLTVKANLTKVTGAKFTLKYNPALVDLDAASLLNLSGFFAAGPQMFEVDETNGLITFNANVSPAVTAANYSLFSASFTASAVGGALFEVDALTDEFAMFPSYGASSNVYAYTLLPVTVDLIELPTVTSDFGGSYYLVGEERAFTITVTNFDTAYSAPELRLTLPTGLTVTYGGMEYTGTLVIDLADLAVDETVTLDLSAKFTQPYTPTAAVIDAKLVDALTPEEELVATSFSALAYTKATVTVAADPYFIVAEPGAFTVTITNPATGRNYGNSIVFDMVIANHAVADISAISCTMGTQTWDLIGTLTQNGADVKARIGGVDGYFTIPAPLTAAINCSVTFATPGTYAVSGYMVEAIPSPERIVSDAVSDSAIVYAKPTISSANLTGPFQEGVAQAVTINVDSVSAMYTPNNSFILHLGLPDGTVVVYGGNTYTCLSTGCDIPVTLAAGANPLAMMITFNDPLNAPVTVALVDTVVEPDRTLATFTTSTNVVVYANVAEVLGTVRMQGRTTRSGVVFTLTGTLGYGPYTATSTNLLTGNVRFTNLASGVYTITVVQARYLDVTISSSKSIDLAVLQALAALELKAGDANDDHTINGGDASIIGTQYGTGTIVSQGDVNFDNAVNIQDLALVGGNFYLTSATAYNSWLQP